MFTKTNSLIESILIGIAKPAIIKSSTYRDTPMTLVVLLLLVLGLVFGIQFFTPLAYEQYWSNYFFEHPRANYPSYFIPALLLGLAFSLYFGFIYDQQFFRFSTVGFGIIFVALYGACLLDFSFQIISDRFQILGLVGSLVVVVSEIFWTKSHSFLDVAQQAGLGLLIVVGLWAFAKLYGIIRRRSAMGFGDFKMLAWMCVLFGARVHGLIFIASIAALAFQIPIYLVKKTGRDIPFAFGPYLVVAFVILLFCRAFHYDLVGQVWWVLESARY